MHNKFIFITSGVILMKTCNFKIKVKSVYNLNNFLYGPEKKVESFYKFIYLFLKIEKF